MEITPRAPPLPLLAPECAARPQCGLGWRRAVDQQHTQELRWQAVECTQLEGGDPAGPGIDVVGLATQPADRGLVASVHGVVQRPVAVTVWGVCLCSILVVKVEKGLLQPSLWQGMAAEAREGMAAVSVDFLDDGRVVVDQLSYQPQLLSGRLVVTLSDHVQQTQPLQIGVVVEQEVHQRIVMTPHCPANDAAMVRVSAARQQLCDGVESAVADGALSMMLEGNLNEAQMADEHCSISPFLLDEAADLLARERAVLDNLDELRGTVMSREGGEARAGIRHD
mmetsp:Transcript_28983/g.72245  ORF Transcript_28983/g.72245 Transcript_28983/m.72245 type:complete len:281 (-) Transcript_28983:86-928(-)